MSNRCETPLKIETDFVCRNPLPSSVIVSVPTGYIIYQQSSEIIDFDSFPLKTEFTINILRIMLIFLFLLIPITHFFPQVFMYFHNYNNFISDSKKLVSINCQLIRISIFRSSLCYYETRNTSNIYERLTR